MTYMLKALIIAAFGATALTAQVVTASAEGSGREPNDTNLFEKSASYKPVPAQKNAVVTNPKAAAFTGFTGNQVFLEQK